jgi:hypothetical protein
MQKLFTFQCILVVILIVIIWRYVWHLLDRICISPALDFLLFIVSLLILHNYSLIDELALG